jgi:hypothetical protein
MFLRTSSALLLTLAACSGKGSQAEAERIACALADAKTFTSACEVERSSLNGKSSVIIRHPDGSFRRFEVLSDGRSLATADGADPVEITANGNDTEITVGDDHYLLPATADVSKGDGSAARP